MNILLVGSGGREHALAFKLKQSSLCHELYVAPGNAGIAAIAECVNIAIDQIDELIAFSKAKEIDFVVVGPETPLVLGLVDALKLANIVAFGPSKAAAQLEGSKGFTKDLCRKYNIPTAAYERFTDIASAHRYIDLMGAPIVVKADGLAAGKGVIVASNIEEAKAAVDDMLSGSIFGKAGSSVVIEEYMDGEEVSYFALCDGENLLTLASAQDHKRVGDNDTGPNTGGMGAYSPAQLMDDNLEAKIIDKILKPTVAAMKAEGNSFQGVLYAGLIIKDQEPRLVEYNARFGDPECQCLMLRLRSDLVELLYNCAIGRLKDTKVEWSQEPSLCVVMASKGYPGQYQKGSVIRELEQAASIDRVEIFHAGTLQKDGDLIADGGRVLGVCATGSTLAEARLAAYESIGCIDWPEGFCRHDIALKAV